MLVKSRLASYLRIYLPSSGFAIVPDTRYSGDKDCGMKVLATRKW